MSMTKLIVKNAFRHTLRVLLTIVGISVAVVAFGMLRTVVTAWNSGVAASSPNRLIVRQAVSFIFPLPYAYKEKIAGIPGVSTVSWLNWFGGTYIDKDQFFARQGCDPETLLSLYPEYKLTSTEISAFKTDRSACIVGIETAKRYGLKIGDIMNMEGDIYPGSWQFTVKGIYTPRSKTDDATQMFFHWEYLNERMKQDDPTRADQVGYYVVKINDPSRSAEISLKIDQLFKNSAAETKTETEGQFQQGFVSSSGAIIGAINIMSYLIIGIILLVLCNTMIMTSRERTREYAVLKSLGFTGGHLFAFIAGEALTISMLGAGIGIALLIPIVQGFESFLPRGWFPVFIIETSTYILAGSSALIVGVIAAIIPLYRALTMKIVDGLRFTG